MLIWLNRVSVAFILCCALAKECLALQSLIEYRSSLTDMTDKNRLNQEDQARVDAYLSRPNHQVQRKPFRLWLLLGGIVIVMTALSLFSYVLAYLHGVV